jgi:hypothetical protein
MNIRKSKIVRNYKGRSYSSGGTPGVLNVEEIATLWHFPLESVVKAPMIQKAPGRKSEPPMSLPMFEDPGNNDFFVENNKQEDIFAQIDHNPELEASIFPPISNQEVRKGGVVDISDLNMADIFAEPAIQKSEKMPEKPTEKKGGPPSNLPFG